MPLDGKSKESAKDGGANPGSSVGTGSTEVDKMLAVLTISQHASILDRMSRAIPHFAGDGVTDIGEWLENFERRCGLEQVDPARLVDFLLAGNASRVYRRMTVAEASNWEAVKKVLTTEYGMPRQEAYRRFSERRMAPGEPVDVYVDDLQRYAARVGVSCTDMIFRVKFYEGLHPEDYEWAVMRPASYTAGWEETLSVVRERIAIRKAVLGPKVTAAAPEKGAMPSARQRGAAKVVCFRCEGAHRVKNCPDKRAKRTSSDGPECYRCGSRGHLARSCKAKKARVGAGVSSEAPGFSDGVNQRDGLAPEEEPEE